MTAINRDTVEKGDILQVNPEATKARAWAGCLVVVTEVKSWGVQGFTRIPEMPKPTGEAYIRIAWDELEDTGGKAVWAPP